MKRLLVILLFLTIPFFQPTSIFAQPVTTITTENQTTTPSIVAPEESLWSQFWNWISRIFIKTDYNIEKRDTSIILSDMTDYGTASNSDKHSSSGTRLTDSASQTCYKGNVIRKVILNNSGYPETDLAQICNSSGNCFVSTTSNSDCETVSIKDLARYFVQINQKFYCNDKNKLIDINSDVLDAVNTFITENSLPEIPGSDLICYQEIYKDFYLVPKDTANENEENSKNIVQTPISVSDQNSSDNANAIKNKLDKNFSPAGTSAGLNGLRPAGW